MCTLTPHLLTLSSSITSSLIYLTSFSRNNILLHHNQTLILLFIDLNSHPPHSPTPTLPTLSSPLTSFIDVCFAVSDDLLERGRFAKRGEVITEGDKDGTSILVRRMEEELEEEEAWSLAHSGRPRLQVFPSSRHLLTSFHLLISSMSFRSTMNCLMRSFKKTRNLHLCCGRSKLFTLITFKLIKAWNFESIYPSSLVLFSFFYYLITSKE